MILGHADTGATAELRLWKKPELWSRYCKNRVAADGAAAEILVSASRGAGRQIRNNLAEKRFHGLAKSPTATILLPSEAAAKPPAVNEQFMMIARCGGLSIHKLSAESGAAADPVPQ